MPSEVFDLIGECRTHGWWSYIAYTYCQSKIVLTRIVWAFEHRVWMGAVHWLVLTLDAWRQMAGLLCACSYIRQIVIWKLNIDRKKLISFLYGFSCSLSLFICTTNFILNSKSLMFFMFELSGFQ